MFSMLQYLLATNPINTVTGTENKVSENKLLDTFTVHIQTVNKPEIYLDFDRSCLYQENFDGNIFH